MAITAYTIAQPTSTSRAAVQRSTDAADRGIDTERTEGRGLEDDDERFGRLASPREPLVRTAPAQSAKPAPRGPRAQC